MQVSPIKKNSLQYLVLLTKRNLKRIGAFTPPPKKKAKSENLVQLSVFCSERYRGSAHPSSESGPVKLLPGTALSISAASRHREL